MLIVFPQQSMYEKLTFTKHNIILIRRVSTFTINLYASGSKSTITTFTKKKASTFIQTLDRNKLLQHNFLKLCLILGGTGEMNCTTYRTRVLFFFSF